MCMNDCLYVCTYLPSWHWTSGSVFTGRATAHSSNWYQNSPTSCDWNTTLTIHTHKAKGVQPKYKFITVSKICKRAVTSHAKFHHSSHVLHPAHAEVSLLQVHSQYAHKILLDQKTLCDFLAQSHRVFNKVWSSRSLTLDLIINATEKFSFRLLPLRKVRVSYIWACWEYIWAWHYLLPTLSTCYPFKIPPWPGIELRAAAVRVLSSTLQKISLLESKITHSLKQWTEIQFGHEKRR